jgi:Uma2 family endonuclease
MPALTTRAQPKRKRRWTEADLLCLPDDGRKYELVNGRLVEVPTGGRHGKISGGTVASDLYRCCETMRAMSLFDSSTGFRTAQGNIRSPDVSVMRTERLPDGKAPIGFIDGAPDLAVEIVSPSEKVGELLTKMAEYFESGTQEVWLLFPERKQVHRYRADLVVEVLHEDDTLQGAPLLPDFTVRVGDLFVE